MGGTRIAQIPTADCWQATQSLYIAFFTSEFGNFAPVEVSSVGIYFAGAGVTGPAGVGSTGPTGVGGTGATGSAGSTGSTGVAGVSYTGPTGPGLTYPLVTPVFTGSVSSYGSISIKNQEITTIYETTQSYIDNAGNIWANRIIMSTSSLAVMPYGAIVPPFAVDRNGNVSCNSITAVTGLPTGPRAGRATPPQ